MKKLYTLLFLFSFTVSFANAQWVTIPDANFAAFLQQNYPQCMNGNQMDTTCSAIMNESIISCNNKNISDLTGIEYFDNLDTLNCSYNQLTFLPVLPASLTILYCSFNQLTSLPPLPSSLVWLNCYNNYLNSLPALPTSLTTLICGINILTSLPPLPPSLISLACASNQITSLPSLPASFGGLSCENNQLTSLPQLPASMSTLYCSNNQLTALPNLPTSLLTLNCSNNQITALPSLPTNLNQLFCASNQLTSLPLLPSLYRLDCSNNQITSLPTLPSGLSDLFCGNNQINSLPNILPSNLKKLHCQNNQINSIPLLPTSLTELDCGNNQITTLPVLPNSLTSLSCKYNQLTSLPVLPPTLNTLISNNNLITSIPTLPATIKNLECNNNLLYDIPELPDTLFYLKINNNPNLSCLPKLKNIKYEFIYGNTAIQCLPNYPNIYGPVNTVVSPPISTYPVCNNFNNPYNCDFFWNISGKVYFDLNNNCNNDTNEQTLSNLKLQLFQNGNLTQQVYSGSEGLYSFDTDTGTFTYTVDTTDLPVYVTCPTSGFHTSILTPLDSLDYNMDFAMQCKPGFDVGVKSITRTSGQFFPGNNATVKIGAGDLASFYGLTCASGISGSVIVDFTGPVTFISEAPGALVPSVIGNTLTYTIPDFGSVNFNSDFRIILQTDTTAQTGNQVCFTVNVTPTTGDNDVNNNSMQHCFSVVNSFDPNAKEVYPEGGIPLNQEWLTYTIHFQNTGNAPAQNIYILDTLDNNLIPETFTLLSYSHEPLTQLFGNVVKFNFPNINLPDSTNDEPNSHGFVQYKIKVTPGLPIGTTISNIAYNFFDFNPPVATNSVSNMVGVTSVASINEKIDFSVFPNPTSSEINISFNLNSSAELEIKLYNSLGQVVKTLPKTKYEAGKRIIDFSVADIPVGVYHLKAMINSQTTMRKIIKY